MTNPILKTRPQSTRTQEVDSTLRTEVLKKLSTKIYIQIAGPKTTRHLEEFDDQLRTNSNKTGGMKKRLLSKIPCFVFHQSPSISPKKSINTHLVL